LNVTKDDRKFYISAIDYVTEQVEFVRDFTRYNGLPSLPSSEISDIMIAGVKQWLHSLEGEAWLASIGYVRYDSIVSVNNMLISPSGILLCPVCSGVHNHNTVAKCECCGREICDTCMSIVDKPYEIRWCNDCIERHFN